MPNPKNFQRRIKRLQAELKAAANSRTMADLHQRAIDLTNEAGGVFIELADAAEDEQRRYRAWSDDAHRQLDRDRANAERDTEAMVKRLDALPTGDALTATMQDCSALRIRIWGIESRTHTLREAEEARGRRRPSAGMMAETLLDKVLSAEHRVLVLKVVKGVAGLGASAAIGELKMTGQIVEAVMKGREIVNDNRTRARDAATHVKYLEDYCESLEVWIGAAAELTERLRQSPFP